MESVAGNDTSDYGVSHEKGRLGGWGGRFDNGAAVKLSGVYHKLCVQPLCHVYCLSCAFSIPQGKKEFKSALYSVPLGGISGSGTVKLWRIKCVEKD